VSNKLPYFRWHPKDFDTDQNVRLMSMCEVGLYVLCLNHAWINGSLPNDVKKIAKIVGQPVAQVKKSWSAVAKCFEENAKGELINRRLEKEREWGTERHARAKEAVDLRGKKTRKNMGEEVENHDDPPAAHPYVRAHASGSGSVSESESSFSGESSERGEEESAPAEFPVVRRIWEKVIGRLKASERRSLEERVAQVPMPEDEWQERIEAYKQSQWAEKNGHPLRGFLKDPQSWEIRAEVTLELVRRDSWVRDAVAARPCVQRYFYTFPKNRRELTDSDMEAAWPVLEKLTDEQVSLAAGHAERNFPHWTHIPSPVNHLAKKPWDTLWVPDANAQPTTKTLSRADQANQEARRKLGIA